MSWDCFAKPWVGSLSQLRKASHPGKHRGAHKTENKWPALDYSLQRSGPPVRALYKLSTSSLRHTRQSGCSQRNFRCDRNQKR
jgi:hypothetical protein